MNDSPYIVGKHPLVLKIEGKTYYKSSTLFLNSVHFVGAIKGIGHIMRFFVLLTTACLLAGAADARSSKNKSKK